MFLSSMITTLSYVFNARSVEFASLSKYFLIEVCMWKIWPTSVFDNVSPIQTHSKSFGSKSLFVW